jgi:hypothetical protein
VVKLIRQPDYWVLTLVFDGNCLGVGRRRLPEGSPALIHLNCWTAPVAVPCLAQESRCLAPGFKPRGMIASGRPCVTVCCIAQPRTKAFF